MAETKTDTARKILDKNPKATLDVLLPLYLAVYPDSTKNAARTRLWYALMHPAKTDGRKNNERIRRFVTKKEETE